MNPAAATTGTSWIRTSVAEGVALLSVDRPPANVLDRELLRELDSRLAAVARDPEIGAVVITGTGGRFFSGADIKMLSRLTAPEFAAFVNSVQRAFDDLESLPKPTIAALNGHAMGGGFELSLACDFCVAAQSARIGVPEVKLGLLPGAGGTQRLLEALGKRRALELLYTGRSLTAEEALGLGLVDRVVPDDRVEEEALALAAGLARGPRDALGAIKACVVAGLTRGRPAGALAEAEGIARLFATPDVWEGIAAFVEKRPASFGAGTAAGPGAP